MIKINFIHLFYKLNKLLIKILRIPLFIPAFFLFILIRLISFFYLVRIGRFRSDKIGHLSLEYEIYLEEKKRGINLPSKRYVDIFFREYTICNHFYYNLRKKDFIIFPNLIFRELWLITKFLNNSEKFICDRKVTDTDINYILDETKSCIILSNEIVRSNMKLLYERGLGQNQKIVLLHLRDIAFRGYNEFTDYKNIYKIDNYIKSVRYLIDLGYYVIRTGARSNAPIKINSKNFLDYPFSNIRTEELDVVIASQCNFCISSGSGFDGLVRSFRKPVLFTNFLPISHFISQSKYNMSIFKHIVDGATGEKLSFKELDRLSMINCFDGRKYKIKNLYVKENTEEEIFEALFEFIEYLSKNFNIKTNRIYDEQIKKTYYNFEKDKSVKLHKKINSLIAPSFLKRNSHFFS